MASTTPSSHAPRRSKESEKIGSFQRQEEIGRGSFATVYKALHTSPQGSSTVVAIKSVNLGKLNKKLKDNLTSEISILKGLHHPHIVALIDCKDTSSHIHLVMEYVALGDLSYFIKKRDQIKNSELVGNMMEKYPNPRNGGLHEVVVRHFLQQLSSALQFLRVRNLIHRDVKPQNLLLNPSPEYFEKHSPAIMPYCASDDALHPVCGIRSLPMLKIADFGFARSLPSTSLAETLCGSPLYMAPEILRYEKYDAKADLWSVGTVLYEMVTSKPPFRAANHVELLRRIEKGEDRIKFGDDIVVSDPLKKLIRSLLKRDPKERMNFPDFFSNEIITGPIPGLAPEDMPAPPQTSPRRDSDRRRASRTDPTDVMTRPSKIQEPESPYLDQQQGTLNEATEGRRSSGPMHRRVSSLATQTPVSTPTSDDAFARRKSIVDGPTSPTGLASRPGITTHATAPGRQELHHRSPQPASTAMVRQSSGGRSYKTPSLLRDQVQEHQREKSLHNESLDRDRAAQDIADEREYVLIEKRAVEVNALADELEASPRLGKLQSSPQAAMMRRAVSQGLPSTGTGAQTSASRAVQIASGRRPDGLHHRQNSYERRYGPSPSSATSAISKALGMASDRLFGPGGFSPPVNLRQGGRSPPVGYSPFPVYPGSQSSLVVVGDNKQPTSGDEDTRFVQTIEEIATRSDVVYGFAEVKFKQLTPATPSAPNNGLGLRNTEAGDNANDDLTAEAIVMVSEEALVLYVKALSLLAKAMDIAARWWSRKNREGLDTMPRGNNSSLAAGQRMNNVVQWTRGRFNEVLEKADMVRMKLLENQKRLPEDHPSHPNNVSAGTTSSAGMGTSVDHVVVSSGITAEKLMYDRALEMSRAAAINELTGEDLQGCEISYVTAIRMLEAVLESDEEPISKRSSNTSDQEKHNQNDDDAPIIGLEAEDRKAVKALVQSIRARLSSLRKKLQVISKRASAPAIGSPTRASPPIQHRTSNPTIAGVSAR